MPNSAFMVRQVRIAASPQSAWRPRFPVGAVSQAIAGSNQIIREPLRLNAWFNADQLRNLRAGGVTPQTAAQGQSRSMRGASW